MKVRRRTETNDAPGWQGAEDAAYWTYARTSNAASRDAAFVECRPTFTTDSYTPNNRLKFSTVAAPNSSRGTPLTSAIRRATSTTKAGSFRLPR